MVKIEVLEETDDKLKLKVDDNMTVLSLVNENLWLQKGVDMAAVTVEHPYLSKPVLTVKSKKARKAVIEATEKIVDDMKELRRKAAKL
ncbi:MAG TPA: RpoL/Rpb11 RNA polymerase subunit family protein [archaeon]|nr:RpoL/Rpb11 RNA polymerase subunit family protein [archaeon]